jgi:hypothetical protein
VDLATLDIPAPALRAYQLAAYTLEKAAPACHLDWSLLAAIGRVESDHGRYGGATLHDNGVSSPVIRGVPLDGKNGVARIPDTDAGRLDGSRRWDRAVGPMQFLPSTWAYTGVDADGDGVRNPDDIDDAALAAGVYLCAGGADLGARHATALAVYRYNASSTYVREVLRLAHAYRTGNYRAPAIPTISTLAAEALQATPRGTKPPHPKAHPDGRHGDHKGTKNDPRNGTKKGSKDGARPGTKGGSTPPGSPTPSNPPGSPTPSNPPPSNPPPSNPPPSNPPPSNPPPSNPPPSNPPPSNPPPSSPPPSPPPSDCPTPTPPAEPPATVPTLTELTGTLTTCGDGVWMVGDTVLDVGDVGWLATTALNDLDGDHAVETNLDELTGLVGTDVVLGVAEDTGQTPPLLYTVNGSDYRDTSPS